MTNIFHELKDLIREMNEQEWQPVDYDEAAKKLITFHEGYLGGSLPNQTMEQRNLQRTLAQGFDVTQQPVAIKEIALPAGLDEDMVLALLDNIILMHATQYANRPQELAEGEFPKYIVNPLDRAYNSMNFHITREHKLQLIVADKDQFHAEPMLEKLTHCQTALPHWVTSFHHGDEEWACSKPRTETPTQDGQSGMNEILSSLMEGVPIQYFRRDENDQLSPHEPEGRTELGDQIFGLSMIAGLLPPDYINAVRQAEQHLRENAENNRNEDDEPPAPLEHTGKIIPTWKQGDFQARMNQLGIDLPERGRSA